MSGAPGGAGSGGLGEPLQPQDLVVTLLGTYVRPFERTVWSGGLVVLLGEFGFSPGAARVALTRLVRRGLIARVRSGRLVHYRVTSRCERLLAEGDGRIFSLGTVSAGAGAGAGSGSGEGLWTVLWHQIPEDRRLERSRLARRLRFLGFGSVQDSVWVSPHDHSLEVAQLLGELEVAEYATTFLSRVGAAAGLPALVARAWELGDLAERYDGFCGEFAPYTPRGAARRLDDLGAFVARTRAVHLFRGFPLLDPELPEELAPMSRPRARAAEIFHEVYEGLAEPSQRHFEAATVAPAEGAVAVGGRVRD